MTEQSKFKISNPKMDGIPPHVLATADKVIR